MNVKGVKIGGPDLVGDRGALLVESRDAVGDRAGSESGGANLLHGGAQTADFALRLSRPRRRRAEDSGESRKETELPIVAEVIGVEDLDTIVGTRT